MFECQLLTSHLKTPSSDNIFVVINKMLETIMIWSQNLNRNVLCQWNIALGEKKFPWVFSAINATTKPKTFPVSLVSKWNKRKVQLFYSSVSKIESSSEVYTKQGVSIFESLAWVCPKFRLTLFPRYFRWFDRSWSISYNMGVLQRMLSLFQNPL